MKKRVLFALATLIPSVVLAHPGHLEAEHALMSGLLHPLGGLDHLLAMLAVGLWAVLLSRSVKQASWVIPTSFVGVMLVGFLFGLNKGAVPMMEQAIAASVLVIGLAAAWVVRMPTILASMVVAVFAFFHGIAHGAEMGDGQAAQFAIGFMLSTIVLHVAGIALGKSLCRHTWLNRTVGTAIGLVGASFLLA